MAAVTSTISGVVSAGQVVVFANQPGAAYTINTWSGTSGTLTGNFTGTTNGTVAATRISATAANQSNGPLIMDLGVPPIVSGGSMVPNNGNNGLILKYNGFNIGFWGPDGSNSGFWLGASTGSITPSTTNFALSSDGSLLNVSAASTQIRLLIGGTIYASLTTSAFSSNVPNFTFTLTNAAPTFTQNAIASTSLASGAAGQTWSITAQAGQAATGGSHNGGAGGNLALLAGPGGASGSATVGIGGMITQFCGQAWQQITKSASTYSVDTNSTTSDLVIFTDSTSNTVTITLPAPSAGRLIYVKDKTGKAATHNVTISQHSAETIDGASSLTLSKNYDAVLLISDGTNWAIIGEYAGSII